MTLSLSTCLKSSLIDHTSFRVVKSYFLPSPYLKCVVFVDSTGGYHGHTRMAWNRSDRRTISIVYRF